ncbi:hypothetical protein [Halococcus thailandensis]|uniref:Uncharacterized protein n=1 Tax=Halococcus thailandensis JCM 13552 TaxID=1227457 RepID=M0NGX8_9EURY|nr:hypothetical protein [Halococcus thailandensis]EMA56364.1 hypothetical protein C451_02764 [Halococcus thailandensis JCM 13552]
MAAFDLDNESLDVRQSKAINTVVRTLDERAELARGELPEADRIAQEDAPQVIEIGIQFAETVIDIGGCVDTYPQTNALKKPSDRDPFATVSIDAYPPTNQAMTLPARYEQQRVPKIGVNNP